MLIDGSIIMVVGMGTVFLFLCIMVVMLQAIAYIMKNTAHVLPQAADLNHDLPDGDNNSEELAVVLAAAHSYIKGDRS